MLLRTITATLCLCGLLTAEDRTWRSADGKNSFPADFVSTDGSRVTLKREDGRLLTFSLSKLHPDDQTWVKARVTPARPDATPTPPPSGAAFGNLEFGDSRQDVQDKLSQSPLVEASVGETFFGRTGLNGIFRTKSTIGGLKCYLFFDWTKGGGLREVTLQTQPVPAENYSGLRANWSELITLLSNLHGRPVQGTDYPQRKDLQDGLILNSHLWRTDDGHSVMLGTGQERDQYNVVVRITTEVINPVPVAGGGASVPGLPGGPVFQD